SERSIHRLLKSRPVRTVPVHTRTIGADLEILVELPGSRLQDRLDRRFRHCAELAVATKTPRERLGGERTVPLQHLDELPVRFGLANEIAVDNVAALQEPAIAREKDARLSRGPPGDRVIVCDRGIRCVDAHQPKPPGQLAQVTVEHESNRLEWTWPDMLHAGNIDRVEPGKCRDSIVIPDGGVKWRRFTIDQNQLDFRMRDAET